MSNVLLNSSMIAKTALKELKNQLGFTKGVNRQYDSEFAKKGAKIGNTINIRKPQMYSVTDGAIVDIQAIENDTVSLVLDKRKHVAFEASMQELTLNIEKLNELNIRPAITRLANQIDFDGLGMAKNNIYNFVGTPGAQPADQATALGVGFSLGQSLDEFCAPMDGQRSVCLNPASQSAMLKGLAGLFNAEQAISKQYMKGRMGEALGFTWKMDQNVNVHKSGSFADGADLDETVTTNGVSDLDFDGGTSGSGTVAGYLKKGDVIAFAGRYAVNPITKEQLAQLAKFVVTEDASCNNSGAGNVKFSPAIYISGPKQNVYSAPTDGDAIQLFGNAGTTYAAKTGPTNIAYHKDAFILGCADLEIPGGVHMAGRASDDQSGLSVRFISYYNGTNDKLIWRFDVLYGWLAAYPEWACRFQG